MEKVNNVPITLFFDRKLSLKLRKYFITTMETWNHQLQWCFRSSIVDVPAQVTPNFKDA